MELERDQFEEVALAHFVAQRAAGVQISGDNGCEPTRESLFWRDDKGDYGVRMFNAAWWGWKEAAIATRKTCEVSPLDDAKLAQGEGMLEPSQAQPPAPSDTAITYMTGYSDGKEWAQADMLRTVEPMTAAGVDAALARLAEIERQEPVAEMTLADMGIGDARQLRVNWLMDGYLDVGAKLYASAGASPVEPSQTPTYSSTQATMCAGCGEHKHTPLRIDAMGGYVCLTCIDQKLGSLLGEFGYPDPEPSQDADPNAPWLSDAHCLCADQGIPPGHITDRIRALRDKLEQPPAPSGQNNLGPSPTRWEERSRTYEGIAQAMADQWGAFIEGDT